MEARYVCKLDVQAFFGVGCGGLGDMEIKYTILL